ncbi:MAG: glycosyltransferase family 4 protein [Gammaproteobacteria bacterium]
MSTPGSLSLLVYTNLFPNARQPRHGIFVERRLRHLLNDYPVAARVVAPVPWFPLASARFGQYGAYAGVPYEEDSDGLAVYHPRYLVMPKLSWYFAPALQYVATRRLVRRLHAEQPVDVIDAHYFYPDGVAAVMLGRDLGVPVCISARGSDINHIAEFPLARRWILWAAAHADGLITVAGALRDRLIELGVAGERIEVLRNGVDLERFRPMVREPLRRELDLEGRVLLSVGNLIELKGHHLVIEALASMAEGTLLIIGEGPMRTALMRLARECGVADRVRFVGLVAQAELPRYYAAADVLVLASSREGWANVLLEAMACGTPVVATRVGGTPEVVAAPAAGVLVDERSAAGIQSGLEQLFAALPERAATRAYAEGFSWADTSRGQYELFEAVLARRRGG